MNIQYDDFAVNIYIKKFCKKLKQFYFTAFRTWKYNRNNKNGGGKS